MNKEREDHGIYERDTGSILIHFLTYVYHFIWLSSLLDFSRDVENKFPCWFDVSSECNVFYMKINFIMIFIEICHYR